MTHRRVSEMTDDEIRNHTAQPAPVTYDRLAGGNIADQQDRHWQLALRDAMARAHATLRARGTYDPQQHGDTDKYAPLTADEHLEVLALGEVLARHYRHPTQVDRALQAGASWAQVAAATGADEATARREYRAWADGQRRLHQDYAGKFGMSPADHAAAIARATDAEREAGR